LAWAKDPLEYVRWNACTEDVALSCELLLLCLLHCGLGMALVLLCIMEFKEGSPIVGDLYGGPNVIEGSKGSVNKESLADGGVEHLKPHIVRSVSSGDGVIAQPYRRSGRLKQRTLL